MTAWLEVCLTGKLARTCTGPEGSSAPSPAPPHGSSHPGAGWDQAGNLPSLKMSLPSAFPFLQLALTVVSLKQRQGRCPESKKMLPLLCRLMPNLFFLNEGASLCALTWKRLEVSVYQTGAAQGQLSYCLWLLGHRRATDAQSIF